MSIRRQERRRITGRSVPTVFVRYIRQYPLSSSRDKVATVYQVRPPATAREALDAALLDHFARFGVPPARACVCHLLPESDDLPRIIGVVPVVLERKKPAGGSWGVVLERSTEVTRGKPP